MVHQLMDHISDNSQVGVVPALLMLTDTTTTQQLDTEIMTTITSVNISDSSIIVSDNYSDTILVLTVFNLFLQSFFRRIVAETNQILIMSALLKLSIIFSTGMAQATAALIGYCYWYGHTAPQRTQS